MDSVRPKLGINIEEARKNKGWTQKKLAEVVGVKRETINQWESGTRHVKDNDLVNLANELDISADALLGLSPTGEYFNQRDIAKEFTGLTLLATSILAAAQEKSILSEIIEEAERNVTSLLYWIEQARAMNEIYNNHFDDITKQEYDAEMGNEDFSILCDMSKQLESEYFHIAVPVDEAFEMYTEKAKAIAAGIIERVCTRLPHKRGRNNAEEE